MVETKTQNRIDYPKVLYFVIRPPPNLFGSHIFLYGL